MSKFWNKIDEFLTNISSWFWNDTKIGQALESTQDAVFDSNLFSWTNRAAQNLANKFTGSALTDADVQANEMSMQNQEDIFQRQVTGMQKAGLNPALMYSSGAQSAPSAPSPQQGASLSDIMQIMMLRPQKDLIEAQAQNLRASAARSEKQIEKLDSDIDVNKARIQNADLDAQQKAIALQYQDEFARADLAIKSASAENLRQSVDALKSNIAKMDAETAGIFLGYLETIERIHVLQSQQNLTDAQIKELAAQTAKLAAEKKNLDLTNENFDLLNGFVTNASIGLGPFKGSGSSVITLGDLKRMATNAADGKPIDFPGSRPNPMDMDLP